LSIKNNPNRNIKRLVCFDRPGVESVLIPKNRIPQEWITSIEIIRIRILQFINRKIIHQSSNSRRRCGISHPRYKKCSISCTKQGNVQEYEIITKALSRAREYERSRRFLATRRTEISIVGGEGLKAIRNTRHPSSPLLSPAGLVIEAQSKQPKRLVSVTLVTSRRTRGSPRLHSARQRMRVNNTRNAKRGISRDIYTRQWKIHPRWSWWKITRSIIPRGPRRLQRFDRSMNIAKSRTDNSSNIDALIDALPSLD